MHADHGPAEVEKQRGPAMRTFFNIAEKWALSEGEEMAILGIDNPTVLHSWKAGRYEGVTGEVLERISHVFGIFRAINTLLTVPDRADAWMRAPNGHFDGRPALACMTCGNISDLQALRSYLDAECH